MDLTFFIICVILIYLIYYLINCIQSLNNELKEVKNKCIKTENDVPLDVNTPNVNDTLRQETVTLIDYLKRFFIK
jgi:uncharacterized protein YoxC